METTQQPIETELPVTLETSPDRPHWGALAGIALGLVVGPDRDCDGLEHGAVVMLDPKTGEQRWIFHTIPRPGEFGHRTWPRDAWQYAGAANNWAGMALDEKRGLVFVPTGSAASDFYGGDRHGDNLFANTLLALDAATGKRRWHFQAVKHDLWDRDFPSPPTLEIGRAHV